MNESKNLEFWVAIRSYLELVRRYFIIYLALIIFLPIVLLILNNSNKSIHLKWTYFPDEVAKLTSLKTYKYEYLIKDYTIFTQILKLDKLKSINNDVQIFLDNTSTKSLFEKYHKILARNLNTEMNARSYIEHWNKKKFVANVITDPDNAEDHKLLIEKLINKSNKELYSYLETQFEDLITIRTAYIDQSLEDIRDTLQFQKKNLISKFNTFIEEVENVKIGDTELAEFNSNQMTELLKIVGGAESLSFRLGTEIDSQQKETQVFELNNIILKDREIFSDVVEKFLLNQPQILQFSAKRSTSNKLKSLKISIQNSELISNLEVPFKDAITDYNTNIKKINGIIENKNNIISIVANINFDGEDIFLEYKNPSSEIKSIFSIFNDIQIIIFGIILAFFLSSLLVFIIINLNLNNKN